MKKFFVTLGLAILVLTGCSQSQTKKTTAASSSSSSTVKKEPKIEEKTTTLSGISMGPSTAISFSQKEIRLKTFVSK